MRRVVLDTNVVVSALLFRGSTSELHKIWKLGGFSLTVSELSHAEFTRVLGYPKFRLTTGVVTSLLATEVFPYCERVLPVRHPPACRDADDDEFLWIARDAGVDMLVTGEPDLLALRPAWEGVSVVTVSEALGILR